MWILIIFIYLEAQGEFCRRSPANKTSLSSFIREGVKNVLVLLRDMSPKLWPLPPLISLLFYKYFIRTCALTKGDNTEKLFNYIDLKGISHKSSRVFFYAFPSEILKSKSNSYRQLQDKTRFTLFVHILTLFHAFFSLIFLVRLPSTLQYQDPNRFRGRLKRQNIAFNNNCINC